MKYISPQCIDLLSMYRHEFAFVCMRRYRIVSNDDKQRLRYQYITNLNCFKWSVVRWCERYLIKMSLSIQNKEGLNLCRCLWNWMKWPQTLTWKCDDGNIVSVNILEYIKINCWDKKNICQNNEEYFLFERSANLAGSSLYRR